MHWLLLTLLSLPALATMPPGDPVKDIITPYPGSWVLQSRNSLYEKFSYPLDAETSDFHRQRKLKELEGDVRRTFYRLPPASGELEAYRTIATPRPRPTSR